MKVLFPIPKKENLHQWAAQLLVVLSRAFDLIEDKLRPGYIILYDSTLAAPEGFLKCDGTEYPKATYPALGTLYNDSTPGNFTVPTVTAPAGTIAYIKT